jgi:hypothetical protein
VDHANFEPFLEQEIDSIYLSGYDANLNGQHPEQYQI